MISFNPVKRENTDLSEFLANGGEVKQLQSLDYQQSRKVFFNKSIQELQKMAFKSNQKTFSYWCDKHGVTQFKAKSGKCVRCGGGK